MSKMMSFEIDEVNFEDKDINDLQFVKLRIKAFSTALTAHNYFVSKKVLKKNSKTILNKPILAYYNQFIDDCEGHENSALKKEMPCGFVPENANLELKTDEDGVTFLYCDAYIWKMYFDYIVELFKRDNNHKSVSVELLVLESEEKLDKTVEMLDFCFTAITILGEAVRPAVDGAFAEVTSFSECNVDTNDFNKAKTEFEKILYNSVNEESSYEGSFLNKEDVLKENSMEEKDLLLNSETPAQIEETTLVENADVVDNAIKEVTSRVKVETDTWEYDDDGHYVGSTSEVHEMRETHFEETSEDSIAENSIEENSEVVENAEEEVVECEEIVEDSCKKDDNSENADVVENAITEEQYNELLHKCSVLEGELEELKVAHNALLIKCSSLQEFKDNTEQKAMKNSIEVALNSVSHILNAEQISDWRSKADEYTVDTLCDFTNRLKAFAFDVQEKNGIQNVETIRNSIPTNVVDELESDNIWDRLNKKYTV